VTYGEVVDEAVEASRRSWLAVADIDAHDALADGYRVEEGRLPGRQAARWSAAAHVEKPLGARAVHVLPGDGHQPPVVAASLVGNVHLDVRVIL
jgi:hypothetical protein